MKKVILTYILLVVLILFGCKKESEYNSLIGKWEWLMTSFGDYNYPRTPEIVDSTYYIEFSNDGYYYLYDNSDQQIKKIHYNLENAGELLIISFEDNDSSGLVYSYQVTNDTLYLGVVNQIYPVTDSFKRIK